MAIVNQERVLSVAVGAAVIVLMVLAILQYRWSRQVGAAVGDRIGATLKASMLDWHLNLLREMSAPCMAMHLHSPVKDWEPTIEDYEQWATTSENSQMVEDVYAFDALHAGDVAFRDGMFHGRLQAQRGETPHLTAGRWSRDSDRQLFVAGYQEGYMQERGQAITVSQGAEQLGYREGLEEGTQDRRSGRAFRLSPDAAKAGPRVQDRQNYAQGYASSYQLSYYGTQEVTDALVIRPTLAAER
jgi:hypothetical protein